MIVKTINKLNLKKFKKFNDMMKSEIPINNDKVTETNDLLISKDYLTHYVNDTHTNWDEFLAFAMLCYNTSRHTSTQFTPYELVFGHIPLLPSSIGDIEPNVTYGHFINNLKFKLARIRRTARDHIIKSKIRAKKNYDKNINNYEYKINDLVLLKATTTPRSLNKKLTSNWRGPYRIIHIYDNQTITIRIESNKLKRVHKNLLNPYYG
jgi:hypothetical protein